MSIGRRIVARWTRGNAGARPDQRRKPALESLEGRLVLSSVSVDVATPVLRLNVAISVRQ